MTAFLLDIAGGALRPVWTNMEAIGFVADYIDVLDEQTSLEDQMRQGYAQSAGTTPYEWDPAQWEVRGDRLVSLKYPDDDFREVSRCEAFGAEVIMFTSAMTVILRDGKVAWIARLD